MKREEKEQIVAEVAEKVGRAQSLFLTDFTGVTVEQANELRREFRKNGVEYTVTKNTFLRKALESVAGYDGLDDYLHGPTAVALGDDDPIAPAKVIKKFFDRAERPKLKVAVIEHQVFDGKRLYEIAKLPGRKEIMASIIGGIQAPASGIVGVLNAVPRDLVNVIDQIARSKAEVQAV